MFELLQEYGRRMLNGIGITFQIVLTSVFAGAILSMLILMLRMSGSSILKSVSLAYIYFFRGTPLLAQTFWVSSAQVSSGMNYRGPGFGGSFVKLSGVPFLPLRLIQRHIRLKSGAVRSSRFQVVSMKPFMH